MPITAEGIAKLAAKLAVDTADEVEIRAAVSSAYYAAFHSALPFVDRLPVSQSCPRAVGDKVTHAEMSERLREWRVVGIHPNLAKMTVTGSQLLDTIETMRSARVKADYKLESDVVLGEALMQISRIKTVRRALLQISNEMSRPLAAGTAS